MSDKEKLDIACTLLSIAIKKCDSPSESAKKKWVEFGLRGSVQSRAKKHSTSSMYARF